MTRILHTLIFVITVVSTHAQVTSWRGEHRDGHYIEKDLLKIWPENGPALLFKVAGIGKGWSSATTANHTIYITGKKDSMEYLSAVTMNGAIKWQVPFSKSWDQAYPDSRGSATIEDDRVYVISGTGVLACINGETGDINWSVDAIQEFDAVVSAFGTAESPLIIDDKVICTPAGEKTTVVAFNKMTGKMIWKSEPTGGEMAFMSPVEFTYKQFRYILAGTTTHIIALIPETGEIAWKYRHYDPSREKGNPGDGICLVNSPIFRENEIFITKGYHYPSMMIAMDSTGRGVTEKWINYTLDNDHGGVVRVEDHIYGANYNPGNNKWVCLDWDTGEVTFLHEWGDKGSTVAADGLLYLYEERRGNIALVRPNPNRFEIISTFKVHHGNGPHWTHLSVFDGIMYVRRGDVLMAYALKSDLQLNL